MGKIAPRPFLPVQEPWMTPLDQATQQIVLISVAILGRLRKLELVSTDLSGAGSRTMIT
jgi:hypothetical protein